MHEFDALARLTDELGVSDDCAAVGTPDEANLLLTTDMLHETTDFPDGVTPYTVGWRSAAISLSDVAGSGGRAVAVVAAYGAPEFDDGLNGFVRGASEVCESVGAEYVGGDLDAHDERTVVSSALGATNGVVNRSGARVGDAVAVTGALGRTAVALRAFENGDAERGNGLFAFPPRVPEGVALSPYATAMTDISDGVAVGAHNIADASGVGIALDGALPLVDGAREDDVYVGEDYELLFTLPREAVDEAREAVGETGITVVGEVVEDGVRLDGEPLRRRGYEH
ncbi:thiamine-phosphate kinase [Haladaptatus sp. F3-133]|uniref:Thiamine-monophosphate kinase n=1 Tax=Halorutilus salinus TaxID=2487751 RepID=A0A9Q4GIU5_9EURY|nr:thiamine-phosphate kinase [Halorutilus salinus]MCX2819203.1 thiamine-phosphate kinase [Halorutilus salinus]